MVNITNWEDLLNYVIDSYGKGNRNGSLVLDAVGEGAGQAFISPLTIVPLSDVLFQLQRSAAFVAPGTVEARLYAALYTVGAVAVNAPTDTIFNTTLNLLAPIDDYYNGLNITFTSGVLQGEVRTILDYVGATGQITVSTAFSAAPGVADTFEVGGVGTTAVPDIAGGVLATSDPVLAADIGTSWGLVNFHFSTPYALNPDLGYVIVVVATNVPAGQVEVGIDITILPPPLPGHFPAHSGNQTDNITLPPVWTPNPLNDVIFYLFNFSDVLAGGVVDISDRWGRQLGQIDLFRYIGAPVGPLNPIDINIQTSAIMVPIDFQGQTIKVETEQYAVAVPRRLFLYAQDLGNETYSFNAATYDHILFTWPMPSDLKNAADYINAAVTELVSTLKIDQRFVFSQDMLRTLVLHGTALATARVGIKGDGANATNFDRIILSIETVDIAGAYTQLASRDITIAPVNSNDLTAWETFSVSALLALDESVATTERVVLRVRVYAYMAAGGAAQAVRLYFTRGSADTYLELPLEEV